MSKYELEGRLTSFGIRLINTLKLLPRNIYNRDLLSQVIRSGTSIGANYVEANGAESRRDFLHKVRIAYKESRETKFWLAILSNTDDQAKNLLAELFKESDEYIRIFSSIIKTTSKNLKTKN